MHIQGLELIIYRNLHPHDIGSSSTQLLKKGIWLYFLLIIFEGALRKWIFPGLATPLLVVRDPIGIWLIYMGLKKNLLPSNIYMWAMVIIGLASIYTALYTGHGNLAVALFGARIMLIHFPVMFLIGHILDRDDVLKIGKTTVYLAIPMLVLIGLQFSSPQTAFVNRGVGGDLEGAGFSGAMGFYRPPGTFSFTNGNALFFSFAAPFIFFFWIEFREVSKMVLVLATIALVFSIPLSISRALLFQIGVTILFVLVAVIWKPEYFLKILLAVIGILGSLALLGQTDIFSIATEVFAARFENASRSEGGLEGTLIDRFLGGMLGAITNSTQLPFWGHGAGMGTNVGSMLLTGKVIYLIAEGEWGRLIGELGILMGLGAILIRIGIVIKIGLASFRRVIKGDLLPWLLLSFGLLTLLQSQWAQPTSLGFSTLIGGLMIASFNTKEENGPRASH